MIAPAPASLLASLGWVHDLNPVILPLFGRIALRWYGLAYALGFLAAWLLLRWLARRGVARIEPQRATDVILVSAAFIIAGGRLGYALAYSPSLLWTFQTSVPFWALLDLTRGGLASHGGIVGAILAALWIARGPRSGDPSAPSPRPWRVPRLHVMDIFALLCPIGLFFGRCANFINGELLGRVVAGPGEPAPWWAVRFAQEFTERPRELSDEQLMGLTVLGSRFAGPGEDAIDGYGRMLHTLQSGPEDLARPLSVELATLLNARHPSQLYQALAEGVFVGLVVWWMACRPRWPGVVGSWFLISYGVCRVATEYWRLPDAHLAVQRVAGLSRGQWLSVAMVVVGAVALGVIARASRGRDPQDRTPGWLRVSR